MPGIPLIDEAALARLRDLVARLTARRGHVPVDALISLGAANLPGEWRIDLGATKTLGAPLVVYAPGTARRVNSLTRRERAVSALIADGLSNKAIADRLGLTVGTVKDHVHRILAKTGLSNRAAIAAAIAGQPGS